VAALTWTVARFLEEGGMRTNLQDYSERRETCVM
jgi:hypothetical protein